MTSLQIKIGGPAGYGIKTFGQILGKGFFRLGYGVHVYEEYPSLIRGGHNTAQITISNIAPGASFTQNDIVIALDAQTVSMDAATCSKTGLVIIDASIKNNDVLSSVLVAPLSDIAHECGDSRMRTTVALGVVLGLLGVQTDSFKTVIQEQLAKLPAAKQQANSIALEKGYEWAKAADCAATFTMPGKNSEYTKNSVQPLFLTGNQALSLGFIQGNLAFLSSYPMTPASSILTYLHSVQDEAAMVVHQGEDEISCINAAVGAAYAGVRSAAVTSGGGFALMNEAISLAGMAEIGLVVVNAMRPGPATGLPTWTGQGDLLHCVHAGHGEFPRVVLAPGCGQRMYEYGMLAPQLAESLQTPVIILSDKYLSESTNTEIIDYSLANTLPAEIFGQPIAGESFKRYALSDSGKSLRTVPGTPHGMFVCNSDEHDEHGYSVEAYTDDRDKQHAKRMRKYELVPESLLKPDLLNPKKVSPKVMLVGWGSTKKVLQLVVAQLQDRGYEVAVTHYECVWPLASKMPEQFNKIDAICVVENNYSGQFAQLLKQQYGGVFDSITKDDGRPFFVDELTNMVVDKYFKK